MDSFPTVSIVIPTYNNRRILARCLRSVLDTNYPSYEVIVVDDASNDGSDKLVEGLMKSHSHIKLIKNTHNLGHTAATNMGVKNAQGEYIAKLDEDTIVDPNWLLELIKTMLNDPTIGIAQSMSFRYYGLDLKPHPSGIDFDYLGRNRPKYISKDIEEVFYPVAFVAVISRKLLHEIGGLFYPDYFIYYEEVDLGWRTRLRGFRVVVVSSSIVRHLGAHKEARPELRKRARPSYRHHEFKNHISSLIINYNMVNVLRYLPLYIAVIGVQGIYGLFARKDIQTSIDSFRALWWNFKNLKRTYSRRLFVNHLVRRVPDEAIKRAMTRPYIRRSKTWKSWRMRARI